MTSGGNNLIYFS